MNKVKTGLPFEREPHEDEGVGETLDADSDRSVTHVRASRLLDRVVVDVDDLVEVSRHDFSHFLQLRKVERLVRTDELVDGDRGEVADRDLEMENVKPS